jgi:hypothetical protein
LRAAPAVGAFDADYLRLHSFYKKMLEWNYWQPILGLNLHHCFGLSSIFGCLFYFKWCFDGFSVVIRQTILQLKTQITCGSRSCCKFNFCRLFKRIGAFESGLTAKLMGTVSAVVFGGSMTLITVFWQEFYRQL